MQLSQKRKKISDFFFFFFACSKFRFNFEHFQKGDNPHTAYGLTDSEKSI